MKWSDVVAMARDLVKMSEEAEEVTELRDENVRLQRALEQAEGELEELRKKTDPAQLHRVMAVAYGRTYPATADRSRGGWTMDAREPWATLERDLW